MIFLLDVILALNLVLAYFLFRNILAPPMLMGLGMFGASAIASSYFQEWELNTMMMESVMLLGGSTLLFTIVCFIFRQKNRYKQCPSSVAKQISLSHIHTKRVERIMFLLVICGFLSCVLKIRYYESFFGSSLTLSELIHEARFDSWSGENTLHIPKYILWLSNIGAFTQCFSSWLLAIYIVSKNKNRKLCVLLIAQILTVVVNGMLGGTKGAMLDPIMRFLTIYLFVLFAQRQSFILPLKTVFVILVAFASFAIGFRAINGLIGRNVEWKNNSDMFSIYMGAQIKNFDIYMHGADGNRENLFVGEETFNGIYKSIYPDYIRQPRQFQEVRNSSLGNVYTQVYSFHKDFGVVGVVLLTALMAFISMITYNRAKRTIMNPMRLRLSLIVYSYMTMPIFMSFFSSRFSEQILTLTFLKQLVYIWIMLLLFNRFIIKRKTKKNEQIIINNNSDL